MKRRFILIIFVLFFSISSYGQEIEGQDFFREFHYGFNMNTNAGLLGGVMFKYVKFKKTRIFKTFNVELVNVKHPQEERIMSFTGNSYIRGKSNYLFSLRLQYGRDYVFFRKAPPNDGGVRVSGVLAFGLSLGLLKPYHILERRNLGFREEFISVQFDNTKHNLNNIAGTGNFFDGIDKSTFLGGINLKAGMTLDFGVFENNVTGFEAGFSFEYFPGQDVILIPQSRNNPNYFTATYLNIYFGSRK